VLYNYKKKGFKKADACIINLHILTKNYTKLHEYATKENCTYRKAAKIAVLCCEIQDYQHMLHYSKYYEHVVPSMMLLGYYYYIYKDYDTMMRYYIQGSTGVNIIKKEDRETTLGKNMKEKIRNSINYYLEIIEPSFGFSFSYELRMQYNSILNQKNKMRLYTYIQSHINKFIDFDYKKDECCICLETSYMQSLSNCTHSVCINCVKNMSRCPLCRNSYYIQRNENTMNIIEDLCIEQKTCDECEEISFIPKSNNNTNVCFYCFRNNDEICI